MKKIKVLVVDDSALVRQALTMILNVDPEIEVINIATDPFVAITKIRDQEPDVITLDLHMPRMDGLTFLKRLMAQHPIPVVVISSMTPEGSRTAMKAFEYGAIEVIVIGASVGGTEALKVILQGISSDLPGILVVQHMPEVFTKTYAESLDHAFDVHVKEAEDGEIITRGKVLIADGDHHLLLKRLGNQYLVKVKRGALVNRHRPSVNVLFRTVARSAGKNAVGIILTGMGSDGAKGLLEMKKAGAHTIAQDESSCVVFGMPHEAIKLGAVDTVLPIDQISSHLISYLKNEKHKV